MNILDNIDFIIPVYIEHPDRLRNLNIVLRYLNAIGANNVFVNEYYRNEPKVTFLTTNYLNKDITSEEYFNKMQCGNDIFHSFSRNKIVCLYDVDVLIPKKDLKESTIKLLENYDFAYPYNGLFYDIPASKVEELQTNLQAEISVLQCTLLNPQSVGGCVMFNRDVFIKGGKLNPNFKNVGYDDDEINARYLNLGYFKFRTSSPLLHLKHYRGSTSYDNNKYTNYNAAEFFKIKNMTAQEITNYIKTWK